MDAKLLLCFFYIILNFDLSTSYGASEADASVVMSDGLTTYKTTLNACKVDADLSKLIPELRGPKGEQGDTGEDGERGDPGMQGPVGPSGRNGEKGDKGPRGPQGPPGNDGTCLHVCRMEIDDDFSSGSLESTSSSEKALSKKLYGTKEKPSPTLCNTKQNDEEFEGTIWVNEKNPFQIYCEEKTYRTCIIPSTTSDPTSPGNEINYMNDTRAFWLSEKGFDMQSFYGNITMNQIEWLQRRSSSVTQKIRFNCKNSYIDEPATSLRMLGWNHIIIDYQSGISPQAYSWDVNDCTVGKSTSKWGSAELVIKSKYPRRIPVIDFQIRDIRKEEQSISVELMELCFG